MNSMKNVLSSHIKATGISRVQDVLSYQVASSKPFTQLQDIVTKMGEQTLLCERSLTAQNQSMSSHIQDWKQTMYGMVGKEYEIPSVESSFNTQLQLVTQYNCVLDILVNKGESELEQLQKRIDDLDIYSHQSEKEMDKDTHQLDERVIAYERQNSRKSRRALINTTNELGLKQIHTSISQNVLVKLDSLEQFLTDAVFSTKKLREEGRGYEHFLYSAIQPYLTLGASSDCIMKINDHMSSMKQFTSQVETHVADSLGQIQLLSYENQNTVNPQIITQAAKLESNRLDHLRTYDET